jgi:hypothetical protein
MKLSDMGPHQLQIALLSNPLTQYFPWNVDGFGPTEYPLGVPRWALQQQVNAGIAAMMQGVGTTLPYQVQYTNNGVAPSFVNTANEVR